MDSAFPGECLEILPLYLSKVDVHNRDVRLLNENTATRNCRCSLEILYHPSEGGERLLHRDEHLCHITRLSRGESANAIKLRFLAPFYVHANSLLVPAAGDGGIFRVVAVQYQIRFRFSLADQGNQGNWLPINLNQLFGLDPLQWKPTDDFSQARSMSLLARGCHPLADIAATQGNPASLYRIRMEYEYESGIKPPFIQQYISWDLQIRCQWLPELLVNNEVPILKVPEPPIRKRPFKEARHTDRVHRRRSERLAQKLEVTDKAEQVDLSSDL